MNRFKMSGCFLLFALVALIAPNLLFEVILKRIVKTDLGEEIVKLKKKIEEAEKLGVKL
jgi:hypothetical protein